MSHRLVFTNKANSNLDIKYVSGSGVGAKSISNRRALLMRSNNTAEGVPCMGYCIKRYIPPINIIPSKNIICGVYVDLSFQIYGFTWKANSKFITKFIPPDEYSFSCVTGISTDESTIVGFCSKTNSSNNFVFKQVNGSFSNIKTIDLSYNGFRNIPLLVSPDGTAIVGNIVTDNNYTYPFKLIGNNSYIDFSNNLTNNIISITATAVSLNGDKITGYYLDPSSTYSCFTINNNIFNTDINTKFPSGTKNSYPTSITSDGSTIVGGYDYITTMDLSHNFHGFKITNGIWSSLFPINIINNNNDENEYFPQILISSDGTTIVWSALIDSSNNMIYKKVGNTIKSIKTFPNTKPFIINGISDDGTTIVGTITSPKPNINIGPYVFRINDTTGYDDISDNLVNGIPIFASFSQGIS